MQRREPVFKIPATVLALLAIMVAVQVWQGTLSERMDVAVVSNFAFVPGRLTFAFDPVGVMRRFATWGASNNAAARQQAVWAATVLRRGGSAPWTLLTYAFLHGGWAHLGLNGLWMLAFGTPVARRFGTQRFLAFMAVAAVWGALAHWLCYPFGFAPVIGASAAISGLMGAAVRFMFQAPVEDAPLHTGRPLDLAAVFRDRRALSFVAVWFVTNTLFGAGAASFGLTDAPIAWQAHVGGFVAGLLLFSFFDARREPDAASISTEASGDERLPD